MKILVTGAKGFVGRNLVESLKSIRDGKDKTKVLVVDEIFEYDSDSKEEELVSYTKDCDIVVHLAGVNRPENPSEFYEGNKGFTETLCNYLKINGNKAPIIVSSSIQVGLDNDYAKSKKQGEDLILDFGVNNGNPVFIYRFANLFGKWCRPNYNSVTATWCYNIAHGLDIHVNDPSVELPLVYIDDVVNELIECMIGNPTYDQVSGFYTVLPIYKVTLEKMKNLLLSFKDSRINLKIPNQKDEFTKKLYATYLSYLPKNEFSYPLKMNIDKRGSFTEFIRTHEYGQVSINISHPGITKGEHWHHTKNEKFLVVSGEGIIQFRDIRNDEIIEYHVSGERLEVIDIPTGYTHNIINVGNTDMVTVIWANEVFNPSLPDTYFEKVKNE
ncbi:TPA: NAD-dependent epimerase/dehydratase family protein [Clostridium perfringens]|uniref:polysaccharide biosynthesis C-terminal domain-containing protein n=1 Tax=Clostridium perfringens TaxID=1502 RepID=UPI0013E32E59|nr:NAD-dependent epimerase/dehydratase family protein [Clostridium perfringens]MDH5098876.1 NAD dependent epimerase/dehydratase family protein [Clostridium perfringens]MDK0683484.1 NAD-dependent epimerase/dehydratase family protein [Clostridium perfringens]MDK0831572.1 NAD-dependent epimerase/dehydratase family protein [Clostridium perfringens]MDK0869824.1 NAD-dependent epimerase/dehydratase family protein [Clostridium perfringens]NGT61212.1 SDR family oxidoreductase [Clostridium perfringens]